MMLGIGADRHRVRLQRFEPLAEPLEPRHEGEFLLEIMAGGGVAGAKPDELETVDRPVGARVARPHRAEPDDENPHRSCSFAQRLQFLV